MEVPLLLWLTLVLTARADLIVEGPETCTPSVCPAGQESQSCSASFQGRESCEALEAAGWTLACRTRGASVWTEILCRPAGAPSAPPATEPTPPPSAPSGAAVTAPAEAASASKTEREPGCATAPASTVAMPLVGLALLGMARRSRRR
jgi:MYXO-CTERM domain-containing protein